MSAFPLLRRATSLCSKPKPSLVTKKSFLRPEHRASLAAFATAANNVLPEANNTNGDINGLKKREMPVFPCVEAHAARESKLQSQTTTAPGRGTRSFEALTRNESKSEEKDPSSTGPEPPYARPNPSTYQLFTSKKPLPLVYYPSDPLPTYQIAYETWGTLNESKSNAILLHTGLSASSHAASTPLNPSPGWWEKFIGPGKALDTNQYFVICTNVLGGCYGSTGPSSPDPADPSGQTPYGTNFPILSIWDMLRGQFGLLDELGIEKLYASVGCSMGAMQSLAAGWLHPERVGKVVSISGTARSSPGAIAMRFAQRSVLMADPNWNNGFYYDGLPPHTGMKLARQIATITYRSGPEWDQRFGRRFRDAPAQQSKNGDGPRLPALCPDFLIETYLDHQGEQFCLKYDANSLIYVSKAMDLFDMTNTALTELKLTSGRPSDGENQIEDAATATTTLHLTPPPPHLSDLAEGLAPLANTPVLILGVQSDILFPADQQRECASALRMAGNKQVVYYELGGVWGHDTFLLDVANVGGAIRGFLS
ncbi:homoserine acetyltransferase [Serendipita vermifera]|nr:homoserine acetyltransferase [Serendipita vermifera]